MPENNESGRKAKKSLINLAKENLTSDNPSLLGDPISLKAEAADSHPTEHDLGAKGAEPERKGDTMRETPRGDGKAKVVGVGRVGEKGEVKEQEGNKSMLGDPVSLEVESLDRKKGKGSKL